MKITIIQPDIIWEDKSRNLNKLEELISATPADTEIVILPEMFNTGFSLHPDKLSEPPRAETMEWMQSLAEKNRYAICGSYIVKEDSQFFNRWIFVSPENEIWSYDKRHLFSPGGEDKLFTKGSNRIVFNFRGLRICPNICYDLRFPVWSRIQNDYDLLINSANWPESRREVWEILLKARAIENQCYVAGVNRTGIDGAGIKYCGDSMILGPRGEIIGSAEPYSECLITGDISLADLSDFRKKFPALNDADNFIIEI
jgi:predicted amidohydrolase